ncbi:MAG: hypothetical protein AAFO15_01920, partial [Pseudomonadota bacterium]
IFGLYKNTLLGFVRNIMIMLVVLLLLLIVLFCTSIFGEQGSYCLNAGEFIKPVKAILKVDQQAMQSSHIVWKKIPNIKVVSNNSNKVTVKYYIKPGFPISANDKLWRSKFSRVCAWNNLYKHDPNYGICRTLQVCQYEYLYKENARNTSIFNPAEVINNGPCAATDGITAYLKIGSYSASQNNTIIHLGKNAREQSYRVFKLLQQKPKLQNKLFSFAYEYARLNDKNMFKMNNLNINPTHYNNYCMIDGILTPCVAGSFEANVGDELWFGYLPNPYLNGQYIIHFTHGVADTTKNTGIADFCNRLFDIILTKIFGMKVENAAVVLSDEIGIFESFFTSMLNNSLIKFILYFSTVILCIYYSVNIALGNRNLKQFAQSMILIVLTLVIFGNGGWFILRDYFVLPILNWIYYSQIIFNSLFMSGNANDMLLDVLSMESIWLRISSLMYACSGLAYFSCVAYAACYTVLLFVIFCIVLMYKILFLSTFIILGLIMCIAPFLFLISRLFGLEYIATNIIANLIINFITIELILFASGFASSMIITFIYLTLDFPVCKTTLFSIGELNFNVFFPMYIDFIDNIYNHFGGVKDVLYNATVTSPGSALLDQNLMDKEIFQNLVKEINANRRIGYWASWKAIAALLLLIYCFYSLIDRIEQITGVLASSLNLYGYTSVSSVLQKGDFISAVKGAYNLGIASTKSVYQGIKNMPANIAGLKQGILEAKNEFQRPGNIFQKVSRAKAGYTQGKEDGFTSYKAEKKLQSSQNQLTKSAEIKQGRRNSFGHNEIDLYSGRAKSSNFDKLSELYKNSQKPIDPQLKGKAKFLAYKDKYGSMMSFHMRRLFNKDRLQTGLKELFFDNNKFKTMLRGGFNAQRNLSAGIDSKYQKKNPETIGRINIIAERIYNQMMKNNPDVLKNLASKDGKILTKQEFVKKIIANARYGAGDPQKIAQKRLSDLLIKSGESRNKAHRIVSRAWQESLDKYYNPTESTFVEIKPVMKSQNVMQRVDVNTKSDMKNMAMNINNAEMSMDDFKPAELKTGYIDTEKIDISNDMINQQDNVVRSNENESSNIYINKKKDVAKSRVNINMLNNKSKK